MRSLQVKEDAKTIIPVVDGFDAMSRYGMRNHLLAWTSRW